MPMSLWLIPRSGNPFTKTIQELITDTVPKQFLDDKDIVSFPPHVTVTSDIDTSTLFSDKSPQEWLDGLDFPGWKAEHDEVILELDEVQAEDPYFRKLNIACKPNANLSKLATICRREAISRDEEKAQAWAENDYRPHLSLLYADLPTSQVSRRVALIEMKIGFAIGDLFACCGGTLCMGGYLVLVDTGRPVKEWGEADAVVARRETPWVMWRASKNLI